MESHGPPDAIQLTRSTWGLLRDEFVAEPLVLVDVKGKGAVEIRRIVGPRGDQAGARTMSKDVDAFDAWIRSPKDLPLNDRPKPTRDGRRR